MDDRRIYSRNELRDSSSPRGLRMTINATAIPKGLDKSSSYQGRGSIYRTLIGLTIIKNKEPFSNKKNVRDKPGRYESGRTEV